VTSFWSTTQRQHELIAIELERAAFQANKAILRWLENKEVAEADQSQIIEEARLHLYEAQGYKVNFLEERLVDVVRESRGAQIGAGRNRPLARFAPRLALWALRKFSDDWMRNRALELACGEADPSPTPTV